MTQQNRRVVVTGIGVATPVGLGVDGMWDGLLAGRCGIDRIEAFDPSGLAAQVGGSLPPFKLGDFIPKGYRKSAKVMARDIIIAVVCAYQAVKDAGLITKCIVERGESQGPCNVDSTRFGANIGAGLICADLTELAGAMATAVDPEGNFDLRRWGNDGMNNLTPLWILKFLPNMLACHVTIVHDAQAPSNTLTCGEASSHLAIGEAFRTIATGDADVCICGGAESKINPMGIARPLRWNRLNTQSNDNPQNASKPFAADRAGAVVGEGGGLLILESLDHAKARGARIYAEVAGFGAGNNATGWREPEPGGEGISLVLESAMKDANCTANDIDLICAFGTGLPDFDSSELAAYNSLFGDHQEQIPAMTLRGTMGNSGAGAGAIDIAAAVLSTYHGKVPPSINVSPADPECRLRFVDGAPKDAKINLAASVGYALAGGQNSALIFRKYEE